jgi:hypothetical protein
MSKDQYSHPDCLCQKSELNSVLCNYNLNGCGQFLVASYNQEMRTELSCDYSKEVRPGFGSVIQSGDANRTQFYDYNQKGVEICFILSHSNPAWRAEESWLKI